MIFADTDFAKIGTQPNTKHLRLHFYKAGNSSCFKLEKKTYTKSFPVLGPIKHSYKDDSNNTQQKDTTNFNTMAKLRCANTSENTTKSSSIKCNKKK